MEPSVTGIWWSFAEADPTLLGVVVIVVVLAAAGFIGLRGVRARGDRRDR